MAKQAHLQAIISAVDRLTPTLSKIGVNTAKTKALMTSLNSVSFARLRGSINVVSKSVTDVAGAAKNAANNLLPLAGLGAVSVAGLGLGFVSASRGAMAYSASVQDAADTTGVGFEELQRLQGAFRLGGESAETANDSIVKFNKGMADAAAGKDKGFAGLMRRLRIPIRDAKGEIRTLTDVLPDLADAIQENENPAVRTRILMEMFGKSGSKLAAVLGQGLEPMKKQREALRKSGKPLSDAKKASDLLKESMGGLTVLSKEAGAGLDKLDEQFEELGVKGSILWAEIVGKGAPAMLKLVERMSGWIKANRELMQQRVGAVVERIANAFSGWIESGGFDRLTTEIGRAWSVMGEFLDRVGGLGNALKGLGVLILAGPMMSLVGLGLMLARLALVLVPMAFKALFLLSGPLALVARGFLACLPALLAFGKGLLLTFGMPLLLAMKGLVALAGLLGGTLVAALGVAARAVLFLGRALLMNPLGILVTLLATFAYVIWKNWEPLAELFSGLWGDIKSGMSSAWESIVGVLESAWNRIKSYLAPMLSMADKVAGAFGGAFSKPFGGPALEVVGGSGGRPSLATSTPLMRAGAMQASTQVRGDMRVHFENAPPGMRVDPGKTSAPGLGFSPDVGYRNMGSIG